MANTATPAIRRADGHRLRRRRRRREVAARQDGVISRQNRGMPGATAPPLLRFPTPYLRLVGEQLARSGVDVEAWRARHGLQGDALQGAWVDLPTARFLGALRDAVVSSGEPALGLLVGERLAATAHGVVGHAALHSTTLAQALEVLVRYAALRMPLLVFAADTDADGWHLRLHPATELGASERPLVEATLLAIHRLLGALTLGPPPTTAVALPHALGADRALAAALFGVPLRDADPPARLSLPRAALDASLPLADPEAFAAADRQCREELARRDGALRTSDRLRALLAGERLASADAHVCARLLALSPRSLERRLAAEGQSFRQIIDEARRDRAERLLAAGARVDAVAVALGYGDVANFRRAFRRWTGMPPSAWRAGPGGPDQ